MRTFTSPSGLTWVARLLVVPLSHIHPDGAVTPRERQVLRFRSGDVVLDLLEWPADWDTLPDDALIALVRHAQPPFLGLFAESPELAGLLAPHPVR